MIDLWLQGLIGIAGPLGLYLSGRAAPLARWGYVVGLAGQPAWLYLTFASRQWGMFAVSLLWTAVWFQGVWETWIKPALEKEFHVSPTE